MRELRGCPSHHPQPPNGSTFMTSFCPVLFWFHMNLLLWKNESIEMAMSLYLTSVPGSVGSAALECHHQNNGPVYRAFSLSQELYWELYTHDSFHPHLSREPVRLYQGSFALDRSGRWGSVRLWNWGRIGSKFRSIRFQSPWSCWACHLRMLLIGLPYEHVIKSCEVMLQGRASNVNSGSGDLFEVMWSPQCRGSFLSPTPIQLPDWGAGRPSECWLCWEGVVMPREG